MDFDPRITSDGHGWHCNFHFGYGHDVIEDAKNEKSCAQALQYLIAKADAEIHDLEDELAILQCQLKWAESDEQRDPYEVCCATFKQKIDFLTTSIKNLRNRNILDEHDMDTTSNIQSPAERIYDIITVLIKQNFAAPDEQVEDTPNEINLLVNSAVVGPDLRQRETISELSVESKELTRDFKGQFKPADAVSEESCSDSARYVIKDSIEARDTGKTDVEVTGKSEIDADECTPEGKHEFLTCLQPGESGDCMTGSKNSEGGSSPLCAKTEVTVKVEEIKDDMCIQHLPADSFSKTQNQESKDSVECHQEVKENQTQSVDNIPATYGRKKSSFSTTRKPQGHKVQKKILSGVKQSNPRTLKPSGKIRKKQCPSISDKFTRSTSPSPVVEDRLCSLPNAIWPRKAGDLAHGHQPRLLGGKKQKLKEASVENASIPSQELNGSKKDDVCSMEILAAKSQNELMMCVESPLGEGEIALPLDSSPANAHVESKSTIVENVETKESPSYDIESLRLKLSQDPQFLNKMKVPELKEILRPNKVPKLSKLKKEKMIEEVIKLLRAA